VNKSYYEPIVKYHENMSTEELKKLALQLRRDVADLINFAGTRSGHVGGEFSIADVMAALYGRYLRLKPDEPQWEGRDIMLLPKDTIQGYSMRRLRSVELSAETHFSMK